MLSMRSSTISKDRNKNIELFYYRIPLWLLPLHSFSCVLVPFDLTTSFRVYSLALWQIYDCPREVTLKNIGKTNYANLLKTILQRQRNKTHQNRVHISWDACVAVSVVGWPFNSSSPGVAYIRQWTGLILVRVMACRLFGTMPLPDPMPTYC